MKQLITIILAVTILGLLAQAYLPKTWKEGAAEIQQLQSSEHNSTAEPEEIPMLPSPPQTRDLRNNPPMEVGEPAEAGDPLSIDDHIKNPWN